MSNSTDSTFIGQPGIAVATPFLLKDTNRGNPLGNKVDNSADAGIAESSKTYKMGKRGTMGPSMKLPSGKLYQKT